MDATLVHNVLSYDVLLYTQAHENIQKAQEKQKILYDKKHNVAAAFSVGSVVLKKDFRRKKRRGGKLDFCWEGPYTITKSLGRGLYCLENEHKEVLDRVCGIHLKPYKIPHAYPVRCRSVSQLF